MLLEGGGALKIGVGAVKVGFRFYMSWILFIKPATVNGRPICMIKNNKFVALASGEGGCIKF